MNDQPSRFVTSSHGTRLAVFDRGEGSALAMVYGALMEQTGWSRLAPLLQPGRRLITYDRRGRGESGDQPAYAVAREVEDLVAVLASVGEPVDVFAHSSGALLVLDAVQAGAPVRRMVLYEPPLASVRVPQLDAKLPPRLESMIAAGERNEALQLFMRLGMTVAEENVARLREGPRWAEQLGYVHTAPYDVRTTREYKFDAETLSRLNLPTLLLVGSESHEWMREGVEIFARAIPGARLVVLEGQGHNAIFGAPELVAREANAFLEK